MNFHRNDQHAGQLILAGDPRQLGPVITSSLCKKYGMEISLMERLANRSVYSNKGGEYPKELITKLIRNFRSHPDILKLPNKMFYDNELIACGNKFDTHSMANWEHLPCPKFPVIFHSVFGESEREGNSPSWFNRQEAEIVLHYVRLLVKQSKPGIHMDEIGVITPYARQVQKIRLLLKAHDLGDVKVGSVETFQGQERKCIIVSTVRSSEHHLVFDAKYNLGFVNHPKRFNVTVTRAKSLLVAIGHPHVLATDKDHWLPLLRMCHEAGSWVGEPWNENADTEEKDLQEMGMLDGDDDDDNDEDTENEHTVSHVVAQEAVGFFNREE
jgi:superfamily I DNA and/or RNA helicase